MPTELEHAKSLLATLRFAAHKHRIHRRKDPGEPAYINHPIQVAELIARVGGVSDLATLQAAFLHDTVEDTNTTFEELKEKFGDEVADLVKEVTDDKGLDKKVRKQLQIDHAPNLSLKAKHIRISDKISNIKNVAYSPPEGWSKERRLEYLEWSKLVVEGCRGGNEGLAAGYDELFGECRLLIDREEP